MLHVISKFCKPKKISPIFWIVLGITAIFFFLGQDVASAAVSADDLKLDAAALEKAKDPSKWDLMNEGVFNSIYLFFRAKCIEAQTLLIPIGMYLTGVLAIIQLCTTWSLFEGQLRVFELIKEAIRCSVVFAVIANASVLTEGLIRGFEFIGAVASGLFTASQAMGSDLWQNQLFSPSNVVTNGSAAMNSLFSSTSWSNPVDKIIVFLLAIAGYLGTCFIALQITLTSVEYYLFTGLGVALLPFSVLRYTQFLSSRIIQGVASFGVKMMVVYFMVGLVTSLLNQLNKSAATPSTDGMQMGALINYVLVYVVMGYLVWKLPSLVQGMISGSPQMEGNGMVSAAVGAAAGAAGTAFSLAGRGKQTWKETGEDNKDGTKATDAASKAIDSGGGAGSGPQDQVEITDKSGKSTTMNTSQMGAAAKQAMAKGGTINDTAGGTAVGASSGGSSGSSGSTGTAQTGASGGAGVAGVSAGVGADGSSDATGEAAESAGADSGVDTDSSGGEDSAVSASSGEDIAETGDSRGAGALPEGGVAGVGNSGASDTAGGGAGDTAAASRASVGNKGDRAWAATKDYGSRVAQKFHETMADNKNGFKQGVSNLGNAAVQTVASHISEPHKAAIKKGASTVVSAGKTAANAVSSAGKSAANAVSSAGKSVANTVSDYTPTPVKAKAVETAKKAVPALNSTANHLGRFSKSMAMQGVAHLPGVRHFNKGRVNAMSDRRLVSGEMFTQQRSSSSQISIPGAKDNPAIAQTEQVLKHFDTQFGELRKMIAGSMYVN